MAQTFRTYAKSCLLLAFFLPLLATAQRGTILEKGEVDNMKIVEDDPYRANVLLTGGLFYNHFAPDPYMGFVFGGKYFLGNMASISAQKSFTLIDPTRGSGRRQKNADYSDLRASTDWEIGFSYHFFDKDDSLGKVKVKMQLQNIGNNDQLYTRDVMTPIRTVKAFRAGVARYRSVVSAEVGLPVAEPSSAKDRYYTNLRTFNLYGGVSWSRIHDVEIDAKNYGRPSSSHYFSIYADAIISPVHSLDPVQRAGSSYNVADAREFRFMPVGLRAGGEAFFGRYLGYGGKLELGYRPGLLGNSNFYFMLSGLAVIKANNGNVRVY